MLEGVVDAVSSKVGDWLGGEALRVVGSFAKLLFRFKLGQVELVQPFLIRLRGLKL